MATYDESQKSRMMLYPLEEVLRHFGRRTDHRGEMYFSPFRDEKEPSFHIRRADNLWMDFGSGKGGNVLTLVSMLGGTPMNESWDILASLESGMALPADPVPLPPSERAGRRTSIVIDDVRGSFSSGRLVRYAESRGIPRHLLERYCSQVTYHIGENRRMLLTAIGFCTGSGWALRHSGGGPFSKRCTGSAPSLLGAGGEAVQNPTCGRVEVFEGFFDFLSWLVLKDRTKPFCDVCVLNSVNNLSRGLGFIAAHRDVSSWMDSDEAGVMALSRLREACPGARDHLGEMEGFKDVSELLTGRIARKKDEVIPDNIHNKTQTLKK